jgi:hypothetical protein
MRRVALGTRLLLYALFGAVGGFWLTVAAICVVLASGEPRSFIELAYWPTRHSGIPPSNYMNPDLMRPLLLNMLGWTVVAVLLGVLHHVVVALRHAWRPND